MPKCEITVNIDGIVSPKPFNSEKELDGWLYDHQDSLSQYIDPNTGLVTFSLNAKEATRQRLREDSQKWAVLGEKSLPRTDNPNSIEEASLGVTLAMNLAGNKRAIDKPISTYDEIKHKTDFIETKKQEYLNLGKSQNEAETLANRDWKTNQNRIAAINQTGTGGHTIIQTILKNEAISPNSKKLGNLSKNSAAINQVISQVAIPIKNAIKSKFNKISFENDIYTELDVYSKEVSIEFKKIIQGIKTAQAYISKLKNSGNDPDKKAALNLENILAGGKFNLHGKIDLIILDENGYLNLYDFKFSESEYDTWRDPKKEAAETQLQLYANMLRQAGYKVGEIGIIPIKVTQDLNNPANNKYELPGTTFSAMVKPCNDFAIKTIADTILPNSIKVDLSSMNESNKKIGELIPGKDLDKASEKRAIDVAYFRSNYCNQVTADDTLNYDKNVDKWYFYDNSTPVSPGERVPKIYFTKENAERVIEDYLKRFNEYRATINVRLGRELKKISQSNIGKIPQLKTLFRSIHYDSKVITGNVNLFAPYFNNGWNFVGDIENNEALWANGYFLFEKNGIVKIIYLDNSKNLGRREYINGQTTIFGNTKLDSEVDKTQDLESTYANLLMMKAMCYIADSDYFKDKRVLGITVKNIDEQPIFEVSNDLLIRNWNKLVMENPKVKDLHTIDNRKMLDDVTASLFTANILMETINGGEKLANEIKSVKATKESLSETIAQVESILNKLKDKYFGSIPLTEVKGDAVNSPAYKAIIMISKCLLSLKNIYLINEADIGQIWRPETHSLGTNFSPLFMSESSNLRSLDKLSNSYFDEIATKFRKSALPWQKLMKDAIEEWQNHPELHYSTEIGGEFTVFNQWFRRDAIDDTKIGKNLILRDPNDSYFDNLPASKKLLTYFLENINLMRYGTLEKSYQIKRNNPEEWYAVPLMRAGALEQIGKFNNLNDFMNAVKAWWQRKTETGLEGYDDAEIEKEFMEQLEELDSEKLKNAYFQINAQKRQELLDKRANIYETNLDIIFLRTLAENSKVEASETFLPMFTAYRTILYYNSVVNHQPADEIMKAANDFIRRRVFRQNIIDKNLQGIAMFTGMLRSMVSSITLGLNMRNFVRENFTSYIGSAVETFLKTGYMVFPVLANKLDERKRYFKLYEESLINVSAHTLDMNNVISEVQQLNAMYRMVDYDQRKMAQTARTNRFKPLNVTEDILYITSNLPDYYHRNAILIASLKYLGAWEAHQIDDETGELKYDMAKDSRYKILFDYNFDRKNVPYDKFEEYSKAEQLYRNVMNEWNSQGWNYKFGDKFELALSPQEAANVRNFGHTMFGCYEPSQRAMINEYFLGSLFFQFKTYAMNQLVKYTRAGGAINIIHPRYVIDEETGEQLYDVTTNDQEYASSGQALKRLKYSEVSREDLLSGRAKPVIDYTGAFMEGVFKTWIRIPGIVMRWNQEELNKYWSQPHVRANILGSLWDNLFMLMMLLLITQMYGTETISDMDEQSWLTQWSYGVITGIARNGLIWEVANSIYGDGTPPMVSSLKRYYNTIQSVLFGDTNILYALTDTFGATRELSSWFQNEE